MAGHVVGLWAFEGERLPYIFDIAYVREELFRLDGSRCYLCGNTIDQNAIGDFRPSIDHIYPRSLGGTNEITNLRLTHALCNEAKRDMIDPDQIVLAIIECHMKRVEVDRSKQASSKLEPSGHA